LGCLKLYGLLEDGISGDLFRDLTYIDENRDAINDGLGQYAREVGVHLAEALSTHEGRGYFVGQRNRRHNKRLSRVRLWFYHPDCQ